MTNRFSPRGIATLVCVMLISTTAIVITAVSARAQLETRRTRMTLEEAQASQLLRAGLVIAEDQAKSGQTIDGLAASPVGQIRLEWITPPAGDRACTIDVAMPHVHRSLACRVTVNGTLQLK